MSINSYQAIAVFASTVLYIDEHKEYQVIVVFGLAVEYIDEHKFI